MHNAMLNLSGRRHAHEIIILRATLQDLAGIRLPGKGIDTRPQIVFEYMCDNLHLDV